MFKKSKKNANKAENKKLLDSLVARNADFDDEDGFQTLSPTPAGQKKLDEIRVRRSKKSSGVKPTPAPARPYEKYDPSKAASNLNDVLEKVQAGKFGKAMNTRDTDKIDELIDAFMNMDQDLPNAAKVNAEIRKLLQIGKSFYDYDDKHREFIDNNTYDGLLARYRGFGFEEPSGIVPSDSKKTQIKYPKLHNNMDKAYAIRTGDPIPAGVKESDKIEAFLGRIYKDLGLSSEAAIELELSPKIDGVSVNGTIVGDGVLTDPQTRGDETESVKIPGMDGLEVGDDFVEQEFGIQYEVFVTYEDCQKASAYLGLASPYVSNRHAASGMVNRLCSGENDELLQFLSFYPIESEGLDGTYSERMDYLSNFAVVPDDMIDRKTIKGNMKELLDKIEKTFESYAKKREKLSYSIDGMVITVTDDEYQKTIGRSGRTNSYQIALKFDPATATAEVKGIHLDTGRKGFRTVQVDLKHPVFLDGVKYDHVPVLSAKLYEEFGLRVGSIVEVHRVGDVIPTITVTKMGDGKILKLPNTCPDCGQYLETKNKKLFCSNALCRGNLVGRIVGFMEGIDMDGYGDAFAEMITKKFGASGDDDDGNMKIVVSSIADLFDLTPAAFRKVGITTKDAKEFHAKLIEVVGAAPDYVILGSIGIPDVGPARAKMLLRRFGGWEEFKKSMSNGTLMVRCIDTLGAAIGQKVFAYISRTDTGATIKRDIKTVSKYMKNITKSFDSLLKVGHTGITLSTRVKDVCKDQKFEIVDGKSFDVLITGSMYTNSEKMEKARKKNLPIYTEEMFIRQYDPEYEDKDAEEDD